MLLTIRNLVGGLLTAALILCFGVRAEDVPAGQKEGAAPAANSAPAGAVEVKPQEVKTEELPAPGTKPEVKQALAGGASPLDQVVAEGQKGVAFNDAVLILGRDTGAQITLLPELSDPVLLKKPVEVTGGTPLRQALDLLCAQVGAKWETADNGATIQISPAGGVLTLVEKTEDPMKSKVTVNCSGTPLLDVANEIRRTVGMNVTVQQELFKQPVEMAVEGWELGRVLNYICFQYDYTLTTTKDGVSIAKKSE